MKKRPLIYLYYYTRIALHTSKLQENDFSRIAAKRWQAYMKEDKQNEHPKILWNIVEFLFQLLRWMICVMGKLTLKKSRVVQKISVE